MGQSKRGQQHKNLSGQTSMQATGTIASSASEKSCIFDRPQPTVLNAAICQGDAALRRMGHTASSRRDRSRRAASFQRIGRRSREPHFRSLSAQRVRSRRSSPSLDFTQHAGEIAARTACEDTRPDLVETIARASAALAAHDPASFAPSDAEMPSSGRKPWPAASTISRQSRGFVNECRPRDAAPGRADDLA